MKRETKTIDLTGSDGEKSPDKKKARRFVTALAALPPPPPLPAALSHHKYAIIGPRAQYYNNNPQGFGQALVFGTEVKFVYRLVDANDARPDAQRARHAGIMDEDEAAAAGAAPRGPPLPTLSQT